MKIITVNASNIEAEHICCALGNDSENRTAVSHELMADKKIGVFLDGLAKASD